jgi:glycosyltransferase involved in cell wall biosynthesis
VATSADAIHASVERRDAVRVAFHIDQLWFAAPGGIGTYVRELLRALPGAGADLVPFRVAGLGGAPTGAPIGGPVLAPVEVPGSIRRLYPSWDLLARPSLPASLRGCEVVHATNHAAIPPAGDRALVVTVHDLAFDHVPETFPSDWRWLYRLGVRAAARRATSILTPSEATAADLMARYGVDAERIRVTPLASSLPSAASDVEDVLARLGIPRPYIVCPATLEARKNQAVLIRAYRQVAPELPHALVLAGPDGWRSGDVDAELARPGPGTILRTGPLHGADLDAVIRGAGLLAYPSRYEGFGLPIVEAMQRGVPVVTSTTPACAETAGDAAELVDPDDAGGLADAMMRILTDEIHRAALIERGLGRARRFDWETTARATLDAYREAAERRA